MSEIEIGAFTLERIVDREGKHQIWILASSGEGMSTAIEPLEAVIRDFYNKNF